MKVLLKSKFTAVNSSMRRERSKINHLSICLGKLEEKKSQENPKQSEEKQGQDSGKKSLILKQETKKHKILAKSISF